jgi:hypothetical protein
MGITTGIHPLSNYTSLGYMCYQFLFLGYWIEISGDRFRFFYCNFGALKKTFLPRRKRPAKANLKEIGQVFYRVKRELGWSDFRSFGALKQKPPGIPDPTGNAEACRAT